MTVRSYHVWLGLGVFCHCLIMLSHIGDAWLA